MMIPEIASGLICSDSKPIWVFSSQHF